MAGNAIGNEGARAIAEGLKVTEAPIKTVDLSGNDIGPSGAEALGDWLASDAKCTDLNLYSNDMGDKGAGSIAAALKQNKTLDSLDIGGNNIRAPGMKELSASLKENNTLTTLELPYNPFGPEGAKARGAARRGRTPHAHGCFIMLRQTSGLCTLTFNAAAPPCAPFFTCRPCPFAPPSVSQALAEAVKFQAKLSTLRIGWCNIDKDGARAMADALRYNGSIGTLDLRANKLGDEGTAALAQSLQVVNETLTNLDLGYNEIKDKGAFALAQALKNNSSASLKELSVSNNYITKLGEVALTEASELVRDLYDGREIAISF